MSCFVAFHYRSYGTFFLQQNRLHNIHRGFTHYKYYRVVKTGLIFDSLSVIMQIIYSMKIKEQTRKLDAGFSKYCFEVADGS